MPIQSDPEPAEWRDTGALLYRGPGRGSGDHRRRGKRMSMSYQEAVGLLEEIAGANPGKCMKCGRCSASCPSYSEMDIKPHQFPSYIKRNEITPLLESQSIFKCLSCFACQERCPRDVRPAKLIEAVRVMKLRKKGETYLSPDDIPEMLDEDLPGQLLASGFRKYRK